MRLTLQMLFQQDHTTFLPDDEKAFLVRVQLSGSDEYEGFHEVMESAGFLRTIKDMGGKLRKLPEATYVITGQTEKCTPQDIHSKVVRAVNKHKSDSNQPSVTAQIIAVSVSDAWFELEEMPDVQEE
ncbi:hypothetical protein [Pseudomonas sp. MWU16-30322]|uniref:hypothetical protein n=1 Tax=Pseudomonas sp. MWU16-30322 TaxID=2878092 RepID=UPI001CF96AD2|nr:hypothetical protein [Pseudomonas sp. MWU16-30322]